MDWIMDWITISLSRNWPRRMTRMARMQAKVTSSTSSSESEPELERLSRKIIRSSNKSGSNGSKVSFSLLSISPIKTSTLASSLSFTLASLLSLSLQSRLCHLSPEGVRRTRRRWTKDDGGRRTTTEDEQKPATANLRAPQNSKMIHPKAHLGRNHLLPLQLKKMRWESLALVMDSSYMNARCSMYPQLQIEWLNEGAINTNMPLDQKMVGPKQGKQYGRHRDIPWLHRQSCPHCILCICLLYHLNELVVRFWTMLWM